MFWGSELFVSTSCDCQHVAFALSTEGCLLLLQIELWKDHVQKTVRSAEGHDPQLPDLEAMQEIYKLASASGVESLVSLHTQTRNNPGHIAEGQAAHHYCVKVQPVGQPLEKSYMFTEAEVKLAGLYLLKALEVLHNGGFVQGDMRIPNVVRVPREGSDDLLVLIDLEGAMRRDAAPPAGVELHAWGPQNEALSDGLYTAASDLWSLGAMLRICPESLPRTPEALAFCERLQGKVYADAGEALSDPFLKP